MKILLVEDDRDLCNTVKLQLERAGYETDVCYQGQDALFYANQYPYDVIVLDRMLPQVDGLTILQGLRRKQIATPVIITTALDGVNDRIDGLDAGADDYLVKPYAVGELLARIRAVTRRPGNFHAGAEKCFADIRLDADRRELSGPGGTVRLSKRETALMEYLIRGAGQILPREIILTYIWGVDAELEDGNLDNYIYFLRRRLRSVGASAQIVTIHGTGYQLKERQT